MRPRPLRLGFIFVALVACGDEGGDTSGTTDMSTGDPAPTTTGDAGEAPPTEEAALAAWLAAGEYRSWSAESAPHPSTGPHFGAVRTYVNQALFDSLAFSQKAHPKGSAAVKELFGDGDAVLGWSVMIKASATSDIDKPGDGAGWYWYERYKGGVYGNDFGDGTCVGCHTPGHPDFRDYFLSPFPLQ